jgi:hypothetical protein
VDIVVNGNVTGKSNAIFENRGTLRMWINGNLNLAGGIDTTTDKPANLQIFMTKAGTSLTMGGNTSLYAWISAPGSDVTLNGTADFYGAVTGKTLDFGGTPGVHYDESFGTTSEVYALRLVK